MYSCKWLKIAVKGCAVVLAKHLTERRSMSNLDDSTVQGTTVLEKHVLSFYWFLYLLSAPRYVNCAAFIIVKPKKTVFMK